MAQAQHQTTGKTPLTNLAGADLLPLVFVNENAALCLLAYLSLWACIAAELQAIVCTDSLCGL